MSTPEARRASVMAHRVHRRRMRLEAAVEAALALLDALDEDHELEDSFDREDDRSDREPDGDGEGTSNLVWTIAGRDMWRVHGAVADVALDPDETAGATELRAEWRMGGGL